MPRARRARKALDIAIELEAEVLFEAIPGQRVRTKRIDGRKLKLPRGARYWFTWRTVGGDYDVVLATERILPDLKGRGGVTDAERGLIALDETQPLLRLVVYLVHEALHSAFSAPGDHNLTARILGCRPNQVTDREEELVTHLAPRWADAILRSGLLRLPPIPRPRRKS